jgi:hypothetical protein
MKIGRTTGNKGSSAVEFAVVAPVLFLVIFGIIEFGWYFFVKHTIQYATREGTRLALVGGQLQDESGGTMSRKNSIIAKIHACSAFAVRSEELQISIYPVAAGYADPSGWETTVDAGQGGDYMRVRTRYTFNFLTPIRSFFSNGAALIEASALYRNELF